MLQKRKASPPRVAGDDAGMRAQRSMASLLFEGDVSGTKWRKVVEDMAATGSEACEDLHRKAGVAGRNVHRNMMRHFMKEFSCIALHIGTGMGHSC